MSIKILTNMHSRASSEVQSQTSSDALWYDDDDCLAQSLWRCIKVMVMTNSLSLWSFFLIQSYMPAACLHLSINLLSSIFHCYACILSASLVYKGCTGNDVISIIWSPNYFGMIEMIITQQLKKCYHVHRQISYIMCIHTFLVQIIRIAK